MNLLKCSKCKQEKPPEQFSINNNNKQRQFRNNYCKRCDSEVKKKNRTNKQATATTETDAITSYNEIGAELKCVRNTVIKIEQTALKKLKSMLNQNGIYSTSDFI